MNRHRCRHIVHICGYVFKKRTVVHRHRVPFQQELIICIKIRQCPANLSAGILIIRLLDIGKGKADHRICPLQGAVFLLLPDGKSFKPIPSSRIFDRKKLLRHAHGQGLPEAARSGDQRHLIPVFPPFLDKMRLIHVKVMLLNNFAKILYSDSYCSRHSSLPLPE